MSIGRDYQNNLYESLRVTKKQSTAQESTPEVAAGSDRLLLEHLEHQANVRELLDIEIRKPGTKKRLAQYSLQITAGSYYDQVSDIVNRHATGYAAALQENTFVADSIKPTDVEEVSGSLVRLSTVDLEANQLAIEELFKTIADDPSENHSKQLELMNRLSNPDNLPIPNSNFSSGIFAYDRIAAAKQNVFIGIGRAVSLLDALEVDCFLEINFEHGIRAATLPNHNLANPPTPLHHGYLSLPRAALRIINNGADS